MKKRHCNQCNTKKYEMCLNAVIFKKKMEDGETITQAQTICDLCILRFENAEKNNPEENYGFQLIVLK